MLRCSTLGKRCAALAQLSTCVGQPDRLYFSYADTSCESNNYTRALWAVLSTGEFLFPPKIVAGDPGALCLTDIEGPLHTTAPTLLPDRTHMIIPDLCLFPQVQTDLSCSKIRDKMKIPECGTYFAPL